MPEARLERTRKAYTGDVIMAHLVVTEPGQETKDCGMVSVRVPTGMRIRSGSETREVRGSDGTVYRFSAVVK